VEGDCVEDGEVSIGEVGWRSGWLEDFTGHEDGVELGESRRGENGEAAESFWLCIGHDGCREEAC